MKTFKVGDRVRITRTAQTHERGWENSWVPGYMDILVGKIGTVAAESRGMHSNINVRVPRHGCWGFPSFVLERIPKKKRSKK